MMTKIEVLVTFVTVILEVNTVSSQLKSLATEIEWKQLDFDFPTAEMRNESISDKSFIPGNSVPVDVDVYYGG